MKDNKANDNKTMVEFKSKRQHSPIVAQQLYEFHFTVHLFDNVRCSEKFLDTLGISYLL